LTEAGRIRAEYERRALEISAERYNPASPGQTFLRQTRERLILAQLAEQNLPPFPCLRVADIGCGSGQWLVDFETWGAQRGNLAGIDLIDARVRAAAARLAPACRGREPRTPGADIRVGDASELPWPSGSFDVVVQSMAISSILSPSMRSRVASEMCRVLHPDGVVVWFDFAVRHPLNPGIAPISRAELRVLFPGFNQHLHRRCLLPPLARRLAPWSYLAATLLESMRVLNPHFLGLLIPNRQG
jgi:ubiquinone/menaquinone biosynthesis C-methylase UbiE